MRDYKTGEGLFEDDNNANWVMFAVADPIQHEDTLKSGKWRRAMDIEMEAIEKMAHGN